MIEKLINHNFMKKFIFLLVLVLGFALGAFAQVYRVDCVPYASAKAYPCDANGEVNTKRDLTHVYQDSLLQIVKVKEDGYNSMALFKGEDGYYGVRVDELVLDESNPDGTVDAVTPLQHGEKSIVRVKGKGKWDKHSEFGHFICGTTPLYIIGILMLVAWALLRFYNKIRFIHAIYGAIACMALAIFGEIILVEYLGSDTVWFCIDESLPWWMRLIMTLLMAFILFIQFTLLFTFSKAIERQYEVELSNKYTLIAVALCVPILIGAVFLGSWVAGKFGWSSVVEDSFVVIVWLVGFVAILDISAKKNLQELGKAGGLIYTTFTVIYAVGLLVGLYLFLVAFFKNIVQFLIAVALFMKGKRAVIGQDGHRYVEDANGDYEDKYGRRYKRDD